MHDIVLQDAQYCLSTWGRLLQYLAEITAVLGASTESVSRTS